MVVVVVVVVVFVAAVLVLHSWSSSSSWIPLPTLLLLFPWIDWARRRRRLSSADVFCCCCCRPSLTSTVLKYCIVCLLGCFVCIDFSFIFFLFLFSRFWAPFAPGWPFAAAVVAVVNLLLFLFCRFVVLFARRRLTTLSLFTLYIFGLHTTTRKVPVSQSVWSWLCCCCWLLR